MKRAILSLTALLFLAAAAWAADSETASEYRYLIQPSDQLEITVWPYEDLKLIAIVRPDGTISYPFVGELNVSGMSAGELGDRIAEAVSEYVHEPKVAVNISNFRMPRVYVLGQVKKPGQYDIRPGDNVLDAITRADGITDRAHSAKVGLIRVAEEVGENKAKVAEVNIANLLGKGDIPKDYLLQDGDIIYVPETKKPNWAKISQVVSSIYQTFSIDDVIRRNFDF